MQISWIIMAVLAASPFVTYGAMAVREKIVVAGAVKAERAAGVAVCNVRVGEIETKHNKAVADAVKAARTAEGAIGETPQGAELVKLCKVSASCRSRGNL